MSPKVSCVMLVESLELYMKAIMLPNTKQTNKKRIKPKLNKTKSLRLPDSIGTFESMYIL